MSATITFAGGPMAGRMQEFDDPKQIIEIEVGQPIDPLSNMGGQVEVPPKVKHIYKLAGLTYVYQGEKPNG